MSIVGILHYNNVVSLKLLAPKREPGNKKCVSNWERGKDG